MTSSVRRKKSSSGKKKNLHSSVKQDEERKVVNDEVGRDEELEESIYSEEDSEDEGVDDEGMERLMKALGEDGLDDFDRAQLQALDDGEDERETEGEDEEGEDDSQNEAGVEEGENITQDKEDEDEDGDGEENEEDIALDDVESVEEDVISRRKLEIDDKVALDRIRETIELDPSISWTETLAVTCPEEIDVDVDDDLNRELAFYKQALHAANTARSLAAKHNLAFTRPSDYFAEMIKSDAHMERIRQKLLDEGAAIKKSEEKRKEREGKKFGKQVQMEKLKERERGKKEMGERLKALKRKRKDALDNPRQDEDAFDVAVEDAISERPEKRQKGAKGSKIPRQARNQKFGFGGQGKRAKQNTKASTDDFEFRGSKGGTPSKGGKGAKSKGSASIRPGKSRRMAARSRR